jgi:HK97 family phage prohead protease
MPWHIETDNPDCAGGFAVVKDDDGEVVGCHQTQASADDQITALNIAEADDRAQPAADAGHTEEPRQMIERDLPDNYRLALEEDVPAGRACGNCGFYDESDRADDMARCSKWDEYVRGDHYCNSWEPKGEVDEAGDEVEDAEEELAAPAASVIERAAPLARAEWRESGAGPDNKTIRGYAAMFDSMSHDLGGFREVIAPGAFSEVLSRNPDVRLLYNHDDAAVMARTKSGTLELLEDDMGLRIWARVDMSDPDVQRVVPKMIRADVDQMSFAFTVEEDDWDESAGYPLRTIRSIGELFEVSIVPFPAYEATKAEVYERARSTGRVLVARATPTVAGTVPGGSESQVVDLGMGRSRSDEGRIRAAKWRARLSHHKLNIKR